MPRIKDKTAPDVETFRSILKGKGLKATPQRIAVHEAMLNLGHASADMVVEKLSSEGVDVTVSSVYNILSTLADLKIYGRRTSSNNKMYFDVNTFNHIHLYDTVNNTYRDIYDEELLAYASSRLRRRKFKGYNVDGFDIQILCHPSRRGRK